MKCTVCNGTGRLPGSDYLDCAASSCDAAAMLAALGDWLKQNPDATPADIFQKGRAVERIAASAVAPVTVQIPLVSAKAAARRSGPFDSAAASPAAPAAEGMRAALERIARWHGEFPRVPDSQAESGSISYSMAYGSNGERDYMRQIAIDALASAPVVEAAPTIPEGWKLVPIEATADMFCAANKIDDSMFAGGSTHGADHEQVWNAMVAAAPAPGSAQ